MIPRLPSIVSCERAERLADGCLARVEGELLARVVGRVSGSGRANIWPTRWVGIKTSEKKSAISADQNGSAGRCG